jgi:hypothetical protein
VSTLKQGTKPGPKATVLKIEGDWKDAAKLLVAKARPVLPKRCQKDHAHSPVYCGCGGGDRACAACKGLGYICPKDSPKSRAAK